MPAGLDGTVVAGGVDAGHVRRPIPASKALNDALLAYEMNGQPLPYDHGFPVRLVVPGWVGVANIKWVGQIEVSATPLFSLWNTTQYVLTGPTYTGSPPVTTPGREERLRASRSERSSRPGGPAGADRALLVGSGLDQARRRQHRRRDDVDAGDAARRQHRQALGALDVHWTPPARGATR